MKVLCIHTSIREGIEFINRSLGSTIPYKGNATDQLILLDYSINSSIQDHLEIWLVSPDFSNRSVLRRFNRQSKFVVIIGNYTLDSLYKFLDDIFFGDNKKLVLVENKSVLVELIAKFSTTTLEFQYYHQDTFDLLLN